MPEPCRDPYAVLGLTPTASQREVTLAYRARVRQLHPDTTSSAGDTEGLSAVVAAYQLLRDPRRRAEHDHRAEHPSPRGTDVPVHVHHTSSTTPDPARRAPGLHAGPVRHHPHRGRGHPRR